MRWVHIIKDEVAPHHQGQAERTTTDPTAILLSLVMEAPREEAAMTAKEQDDAHILLTDREIKSTLETDEKHQNKFAELFERPLLGTSLPTTIIEDDPDPKNEMRIVMVGLDEAGKTCILYKLIQKKVKMIPTIGFNIETVEYNNLKFTIWDIGGLSTVRALWKHYYFQAQALIFVVDSNARERLSEAHNELAKLMSEKGLKDLALLVFANKQDITGCMTIEEIAETLKLTELCSGRSWHIQAADARSGVGLHDGLKWLAQQHVAAEVTDDV